MIFMFGGTLAGLLTLRPLGRLIDRFGRKPVMVVCAFAAAFGIMPWAFITRSTPDLGLTTAVNWLCHMACTPFGHGNYVLLSPELPVGAFMAGAATAAFAGIAWAGVALAQTSYVFSFSDLKGSSKYVAAFSVLASFGVVIAGIAGGYLTEWLNFLQARPIICGPFAWNNWHVAFVVGGLARIAGIAAHAAPAG